MLSALRGSLAGVEEGTRHRSVEATPEEKARTLPGDERIPQPSGSLTHAITIHRPPRDVWPWLAQMGAGRAGWYSYDALDNGGRPSTWRIVPELQPINVGMIFPALPGRTDGFRLIGFEPERFLVLAWLAPDGTPMVTWAFVLDQPAPDETRLIVRARGGPDYRFHRLPKWLGGRVVEFIHFIMERKQLLGIAQRAERS